jgi:hypothetical protein
MINIFITGEKMDTISFEKKIMKGDFSDNIICAVTIINGRPFADIVKQYEPEAMRKGGKLPDGKMDKHCWESEYNFGYGLYQGAGNLYNELNNGDCWLDDDKAVLMICSCGEEGCWPLAVSFNYTETEVVWSKFNNWHRSNWNYSVFPVFRFDKKQYDEELLKLRIIAREDWEKNQNLYMAKMMFSVNNKPDLLKDTDCGCFFCLRVFTPYEIKEWRTDKLGTALCPYCGHDTIIGKSSGYPISNKISDYITTRDFLKSMKKRWFEDK